MIRTALRLSTIAALTRGGVEPFPTLAGRQVWDSRQDAIEDLIASQRLPIIVVRTDEDRRDRGPSPVMRERAIDLRLEMSVLTARQDEGEWVVGWPETDAELEAMLDLMEYQCLEALMGWGPWALWWRELWTWSSEISTPIWTQPSEGRIRLAVRELTIAMSKLPGECFPRMLLADETPEAPALPEFLVRVFDKIAADGAGELAANAAQIRAVLEAQDLPARPTAPRLRVVRMKWLEPEVATPVDETPHADIDANITLPE
jgi:hypothetical protein